MKNWKDILLVILIAIGCFLVGRLHRSEQVHNLQKELVMRQQIFIQTQEILKGVQWNDEGIQLFNRLGYVLPVGPDSTKTD
jgi:hypothetical protein